MLLTNTTGSSNSALGNGADVTTINGGDVAGITLSAIQALAAENAALKAQLAERDARDLANEARLARLEALLPASSAPEQVSSTR